MLKIKSSVLLWPVRSPGPNAAYLSDFILYHVPCPISFALPTLHSGRTSNLPSVLLSQSFCTCHFSAQNTCMQISEFALFVQIRGFYLTLLLKQLPLSIQDVLPLLGMISSGHLCETKLFIFCLLVYRLSAPLECKHPERRLFLYTGRFMVTLLAPTDAWHLLSILINIY